MNAVLPNRPLQVRDKLLTQGAESLSDIELLAIFISSGNRKKSCLQLAVDLIQHFGDMRQIIHADITSFKKISGLGEVRFLQLQAAKEMCLRSHFIRLKKEIKLSNSQETYSYLKRKLRDNKNETFAALFLDSQNNIIAYEELFKGTIHSAAIYPRPLIERVLQHNAASVILAHNHPSGQTKASQQDIDTTIQLKQVLASIDTRLLDHVIIGDNEVFSIMTSMTFKSH